MNGTIIEDSEDSLVVAKAVAMSVLTAGSFGFGWLPTKLATWASACQFRRPTSSMLLLQLMLNFGGGALLCTTFLHMLPELRESVELLQESGKLVSTRFHLAELLVCSGFFALYLLEEIAHFFLHRNTHQHSVVLLRSLSTRKCSGSEKDGCTAVGEVDAKCNSPVSTLQSVVLTEPDNASRVILGPPTHDHAHHHLHIPEETSTVSPLRGFLIVFALSIHELFEGLAIGLQSTTSMVWYMLAAVAVHKLVLAFCVGVELASANIRTFLIFVYLSTFALVSPAGIGIGMGLDDDEIARGVTTTLLQGVATGTLLYVVFFEVLQRNAAVEDRMGFVRLLSIATGFGLMFGLLVAGPKVSCKIGCCCVRCDGDLRFRKVSAPTSDINAAFVTLLRRRLGAYLETM